MGMGYVTSHSDGSRGGSFGRAGDQTCGRRVQGLCSDQRHVLVGRPAIGVGFPTTSGGRNFGRGEYFSACDQSVSEYENEEKLKTFFLLLK